MNGRFLSGAGQRNSAKLSIVDIVSGLDGVDLQSGLQAVTGFLLGYCIVIID